MPEKRMTVTQAALQEPLELRHQDAAEDHGWVSELAGMSQRKIGRVISLQALYESDFSNDERAQIFARSALCEKLNSEETRRAKWIVEKAYQSKAALDKKIGSMLKYGSTETMPKVELNIIRLALVEADICCDTDMAVVANEAVELGKLFGGEKAPGFINKVLNMLLGGRNTSSSDTPAEAASKSSEQRQ